MYAEKVLPGWNLKLALLVQPLHPIRGQERASCLTVNFVAEPSTATIIRDCLSGIGLNWPFRDRMLLAAIILRQDNTTSV